MRINLIRRSPSYKDIIEVEERCFPFFWKTKTYEVIKVNHPSGDMYCTYPQGKKLPPWKIKAIHDLIMISKFKKHILKVNKGIL